MVNATEESRPNRRRGVGPVPYRERQRLQSMNRTIKMGERAADDRAALMMGLREQGYSLDSIADAANLNRESVRKSIMRRSPGGYPGDVERRASNGQADA